jgi:HlyD family secretion protein
MKKINTNRSLRRLQLAGYTSVFVMVGVVGSWAALSQLNGAVIAPATIVAETYSKKIQHRDGGTVKAINVKDGDLVQAGEPLVVFDDTDAKSDLAIITSLLDESLAKRSRLEAQRERADAVTYPADLMQRAKEPALAEIISGQNKLFSARLQTINGKKNQLSQQVDQLQEQISGVESQIQSKDKQLKYIAAELTDLKALQQKGLVPVSRVSAMDRESARLNGERGELVAAKASTEARITEVKLQIMQVDEDDLAQTLTDLRDIDSRVSELKERQVAATSRLERTVVKAPITGRVYQMAIHTVGGVLGAGEAIMYLLPENDDLVLQAQVKPQDIDQVQAGQYAHVKFPAFNARLTPDIAAEVTQVSADTSRTDANSPPVYVVRLTLSATEIAKLGDNKLKPGMPAEAFIQTRALSPMWYLLKPLTDQINHAWREG